MFNENDFNTSDHEGASLEERLLDSRRNSITAAATDESLVRDNAPEGVGGNESSGREGEDFANAEVSLEEFKPTVGPLTAITEVITAHYPGFFLGFFGLGSFAIRLSLSLYLPTYFNNYEEIYEAQCVKGGINLCEASATARADAEGVAAIDAGQYMSGSFIKDSLDPTFYALVAVLGLCISYSLLKLSELVWSYSRGRHNPLQTMTKSEYIEHMARTNYDKGYDDSTDGKPKGSIVTSDHRFSKFYVSDSTKNTKIDALKKLYQDWIKPYKVHFNNWMILSITGFFFTLASVFYNKKDTFIADYNDKCHQIETCDTLEGQSSAYIYAWALFVYAVFQELDEFSFGKFNSVLLLPEVTTALTVIIDVLFKLPLADCGKSICKNASAALQSLPARRSGYALIGSDGLNQPFIVNSSSSVEGSSGADSNELNEFNNLAAQDDGTNPLNDSLNSVTDPINVSNVSEEEEGDENDENDTDVNNMTIPFDSTTENDSNKRISRRDSTMFGFPNQDAASPPPNTIDNPILSAGKDVKNNETPKKHIENPGVNVLNYQGTQQVPFVQNDEDDANERVNNRSLSFS